jgi:hypothetical protein
MAEGITGQTLKTDGGGTYQVFDRVGIQGASPSSTTVATYEPIGQWRSSACTRTT